MSAITADIPGFIEPGIIIGPSQDPHHPSLRPSERRRLNEADVLLWVGPQLENALSDVIDPESPGIITAYELVAANGLALPDRIDPHVWLSTINARLIARALAEKLGAVDAANHGRYMNNLDNFNSAMDELDARINTTLRNVKDKPFAVYHNAFGYFEQQYGLSHVAAYTENEELQPGIRKVLAVRDILESNNVRCVLLEPSNNPAEIRQLTGRDMNLVAIDWFGFDYAASKTGYGDFMLGVTEAISGCLQ